SPGARSHPAGWPAGASARNRGVSMSARDDRRDEWVRLILAGTEPVPPEDGHVEPDTLAVLAEGGPGAGELAGVWAHLAACPPCRRLVSATLSEAARADDAVAEARKPGVPVAPLR